MTDEAIHVLARILLRICSPGRAHAILTRIGALFSSHADRAGLLRASAHLRRQGTCLSRALAIAARAPQAEVVIGVAPRSGQPLLAHAWLELAGEPVDASDVAGNEIVRLGSALRAGLPPLRDVSRSSAW
jgi:hypothetical protein